MKQVLDFAGRTVLVTGGARGIGREVTRQLVRKGAKVLIVARNESALGRLKADEPDVTGVLAVDLAEPGAARRVADWVATEHPETSVLINNAAIMLHSDLTDPGRDHGADIGRELAINLTAPTELATLLLPVLARHPKSAVINVTSGLAIAPIPDAAVYCATKAGLRMFTRAFRDQCRNAGFDLQVTEVVMTLVETTLSRADHARRYPPERAAADLIAGVEQGRDEVWIEKTKLLRIVHRISPRLAYRIMRGKPTRAKRPLDVPISISGA